MLKYLLLSFLLFLSTQALGQTATITGKIIDPRTKAAIAGVNLKLIATPDTSKATNLYTGKDGGFSFTGLGPGTYRLEATCVGRTKITRTIRVTGPNVELGTLSMSQTVISLGEILIEGRVPPAEQKGDTTELNARAVKVNPDADAGDLLQKMPGIAIESGTVKAYGEDVQQVLVDGKPFFGEDATLALRNLPADAIEKVQVYDRASDQAQFTGFDDGRAMRTINIVTRADRRNSQFGRLYGGYGDQGRYTAGGNVSFFGGERRISLTGLSNNVGTQNFSMQDFLGVTGSGSRMAGGGGGFGGRGGGGFGGGGGPRGGGGGGGGAPVGGPGGGMSGLANFFFGQQGGMTSPTSLGQNYQDMWGSKLAVTESYFYNGMRNETDQQLHRDYAGVANAGSSYYEDNASDSHNFNHRVNLRMEYTADSLNSLILQPSLSFQNNRSSSLADAANLGSSQEYLNATQNARQSNTSGYSFSNNLVYRHKFDLPGRTISADFGTRMNKRDGSTNQQSNSVYYQGISPTIDTLNQQTPTLTNGYTLNMSLAYTEPVTVNSMVQFTYQPSYSRNKADNKRYLWDPLTQDFTLPSLENSNTYENWYSTQNAGMGYLLKFEKFSITAGVAYQVASLRGEQVLPYASTVRKTFYTLMPNMRMTYQFGGRSNLNVTYRTSTREPSVTQLQTYVDNSNPLLLSTGNPNLKQSVNHSLVARLGLTNPEEGQSLFILLSGGTTFDNIGNATVVVQRDSVIQGGVTVNRGTQVSYPVNVDGYWNGRANVMYGFPVDFFRSNLNLNAGYTYSRSPALINTLRSITNNNVVSGGLAFVSNISENVDFTLSYTGNYTIARNSLQPDQDANYFSQTARFILNLIVWQGIVFRNETYNTLYNGLSADLDKNYVLWNLFLGKKLFTDQRAEIRIGVTDLLNQNRSVGRNVTDTYVEDSQTRVLGRYLMAMFTYTIR